MAQTTAVPTNAFAGRKEMPTDEDLASELGGSALANWRRLLDVLTADRCIDAQEWHSYSVRAGWALRLKHGQRAIVYLSPRHQGFLASFALGDKAIQATKAAGLPPAVMKIISEAKRYAEGAAVRLDVNGPSDIAAVRKIAAIKLAN